MVSQLLLFGQGSTNSALFGVSRALPVEERIQGQLAAHGTAPLPPNINHGDTPKLFEHTHIDIACIIPFIRKEHPVLLPGDADGLSYQR